MHQPLRTNLQVHARLDAFRHNKSDSDMLVCIPQVLERDVTFSRSVLGRFGADLSLPPPCFRFFSLARKHGSRCSACYPSSCPAQDWI